MPAKLITKTCKRCGQDLPRDAFNAIPRSDSPTTRLDSFCSLCRQVVNAEREARRRRPNTTVLCACGCGKPTNLAPVTDPARGWVAGQPMKYLRGHNMRKEPYPDAPYVVDSVTGCWNWQLGRDRDGYALMHKGGRRYRAHRWYYEQRFGPLPDGTVPDHACPHGPNRACVNPEHMRPLTVEDNSRYKSSTRLTREIVAEIRALKGMMPQRAIGKRFGISQSHVSAILAGQHWPE